MNLCQQHHRLISPASNEDVQPYPSSSMMMKITNSEMPQVPYLHPTAPMHPHPHHPDTMLRFHFGKLGDFLRRHSHSPTFSIMICVGVEGIITASDSQNTKCWRHVTCHRDNLTTWLRDMDRMKWSLLMIRFSRQITIALRRYWLRNSTCYYETDGINTEWSGTKAALKYETRPKAKNR